MKQFLLSVWEVVEVVVVAVVTVFIIRSYLVQPFLVSGASMEPNFSSGDYLIIDEISYRFRDPKRGEAIVFRYPENPEIFYIKRVIGLPGERVVIRDGVVTIFNEESSEGFTLNESYIAPAVRTSGNVETLLSEGEYFVVGNNRNYSFDSRSWGVLPKENFIGLVRLRLFPFTEFKAFAY